MNGKGVQGWSKSEDLPRLISLKLSGNKAEEHWQEINLCAINVYLIFCSLNLRILNFPQAI